jgi:type II secretory ATPase GspE/PulE/Tfp pilus assembly ATPase PilB-like protein
MSSLAQRMNDLILRAAAAGEPAEMEPVAQLVQDAARGQRSVVEDLIDSKLVTEELFLEALAGELRMHWESDLRPRNSKRLKEVCSATVALQHRVLPLWFGEFDPGMPGEDDDLSVVDTTEDGAPANAASEAPTGKLRLALVTYDPFNLQARQAVSQGIAYPVEWRLASRTRLLAAIQKMYGLGADVFEAILKGRDFTESSALDIGEETNVLDEDDDEASVVKFVNQILRQALQSRATDIHVEPMENNLRIRYRVDGLLQDVPVPDNIKALQSMVIARLKIMSRLDIAERRLPQDGRIALELEGSSIDVRVATVPTVLGESVSLRLLNQQKYNLDKLGFLPGTRAVVQSLLKLSNGIVLITGPTGSGKSTSLYTFLSELNAVDTRIVTVEDPVENKIEGVMQIAVKPEIQLTFARGLRSILRADPDIVMVGEMRDKETAEIAIQSALTGHLVFSTLHTNDSIAGITRLVDMGVEPFLVAASIRAFLAQRLVRKLCQKCKVRHPVDWNEFRKMGYTGQPVGDVWEPKHKGCDHCNHTGFYGRFAIYEIAVITKEIAELVTRRASEAEIRNVAIGQGFMPMRDYGLHKVLSGDTSLEEVMSVTMMDMAMEG